MLYVEIRRGIKSGVFQVPTRRGGSQKGETFFLIVLLPPHVSFSFFSLSLGGYERRKDEVEGSQDGWLLGRRRPFLSLFPLPPLATGKGLLEARRDFLLQLRPRQGDPAEERGNRQGFLPFFPRLSLCVFESGQRRFLRRELGASFPWDLLARPSGAIEEAMLNSF